MVSLPLVPRSTSLPGVPVIEHFTALWPLGAPVFGFTTAGEGSGDGGGSGGGAGGIPPGGS